MSKKEKPKTIKPGDKIKAGNVQGSSAVALGRGARAEVNIFNRKIYVDLRLLPLVFLLLIAVVILSYIQFRNNIPTTMTGEFNIAIAEFTVLDKAGNAIRSDEGQKLADWLYKRLANDLSELDIKYEIWPPEFTGRINHNLEAEDRASEIKAHVIIYGNIILDDDQSKFSPAFFVSSSGFIEADEITGEHQLGDALLIALPFDSTQLQDIENPALSARSEALSLISIGLAYYSIDDYLNALDYFDQAKSINGWLNSAGKEIVYLLLGNANVRLSSKEKSIDYIENSLDYYEKALNINPSYSRAIVGQASAEYLLSLGDPNGTFEDIDLALLEDSEKTFEYALEVGDPPESANIQAKVHFGLGQVYFVRYQVLGEDWLQKARNEFEDVVNEHKKGNFRIANLAGHAYARLGVIARMENNATQAIEYYQNAVRLVSPFYQAYYTTRIGEIYIAAGNKDLAIKAYEDAIQVAEFYGDAQSAEEYSTRLNEIRQMQ